MDYPLIINDIVRLGAHPSDFFHRAKNLNINYPKKKLDFILSIANEAELLSVAGKGWRKGKRFSQLLKGNVGRYWYLLYSTFLETESWDELPLVVNLKSMGERETPGGARKFVISELQEGEPKEAFKRRLREKYPEFYRKGGVWKLRREKRTPEWEELEGPLIDLILKELEWLNILDSGEKIKFTQAGKDIIKGKIPDFIFEKPVVKPDYEVIARVKIHPGDLYFLERVAEPVSCDGIYIYRISRQSVLSLIEKGQKPEDILKAMRNWGELPVNLEENIKTWGARFSKLKLKFGIVVEFESTYLLKEVLQIKEIGEILRPVGEKTAIAKVEDMAKLKKLLRSNDYYAEVPRKWESKKILYLNEEERKVLKKVLTDSLEELKFPYNLTIEEIIDKL